MDSSRGRQMWCPDHNADEYQSEDNKKKDGGDQERLQCFGRGGNGHVVGGYDQSPHDNYNQREQKRENPLLHQGKPHTLADVAARPGIWPDVLKQACPPAFLKKRVFKMLPFVKHLVGLARILHP